jgi:hypothetical protein
VQSFVAKFPEEFAKHAEGAGTAPEPAKKLEAV